MWVQMKALEIFRKFMPVLFMIGVWKCHLDTWLCSYMMFGGGHVGPDDGPFLFNVSWYKSLGVFFSLRGSNFGGKMQVKSTKTKFRDSARPFVELSCAYQ